MYTKKVKKTRQKTRVIPNTNPLVLFTKGIKSNATFTHKTRKQARSIKKKNGTFHDTRTPTILQKTQNIQGIKVSRYQKKSPK